MELAGAKRAFGGVLIVHSQEADAIELGFAVVVRIAPDFHALPKFPFGHGVGSVGNQHSGAQKIGHGVIKTADCFYAGSTDGIPRVAGQAIEKHHVGFAQFDLDGMCIGCSNADRIGVGVFSRAEIECADDGIGEVSELGRHGWRDPADE